MPGESIGAGWVFGLNEALDQAGATAGPLLIAYILSSHGSYRMGFGVFIVPAILCLPTVVFRAPALSATARTRNAYIRNSVGNEI